MKKQAPYITIATYVKGDSEVQCRPEAVLSTSESKAVTTYKRFLSGNDYSEIRCITMTPREYAQVTKMVSVLQFTGASDSQINFGLCALLDLEPEAPILDGLRDNQGLIKSSIDLYSFPKDFEIQNIS